MPIYEYRCLVCKEVVEVFRSIGDADKKMIHNSDKNHKGETPKMHRISSISSFHLKGMGWGKHGYTPPAGTLNPKWAGGQS